MTTRATRSIDWRCSCLPATVLALVMLLVWAQAGLATVPLEDTASKEQRALFLRAELAASSGRTDEARILLQRLDDYPLRPYVEYALLEPRMASAQPSALRAFIAGNAGSPLGERLRTRWLALLAARGAWSDFITDWVPQGDRVLRCHHARALYETGGLEQAHAATAELWRSGTSQPDACDLPFKRWREAGQLTKARLWERIGLAVRSGEARLANFLAQELPPAMRAAVEHWLSQHADPALVLVDRHFLPDSPHLREIRLHGLTRLALRQPSRAEQAWMAMREHHAWSESQLAEANRALGLGFAQEHLGGGGAYLDAVPNALADERVIEWRVLTRLRHTDWPGVLAALDRLPVDEVGDVRWRYWRARAMEQLNLASEATALFREVATDRGFYGFLAADRLGLAYNFAERPLRFSREELLQTAALGGIARARELHVIGRDVDARREWYAAIRDMDETDLLRAAHLATLWNWHPQAIFTVARAAHFDDLELRFPVLYAAHFHDSAMALDLDPAWLLAVARQESAFVDDARSPAGALGLMQIMPATGRHIARSLSEPFNGDATLLQPGTSIRYGAWYLRDLLNRFGGHKVLATAAYNAGPHRAERWRPRNGAMEADVWIETVPYAETRSYLRRILSYTAIYQHRMGRESVRLSTRLTAVPARRPDNQAVIGDEDDNG